jgi:LuxR family transcriptional regulator, maltose regulon positive regulatory protein
MPSRNRPGKSTRKASVQAVAETASAQPTFFLRTKLLPPRPSPELLSRPRLTERLQANLAQPVTLVTANAGSGKTTLVADFLRTNNRQFVWYQLDHTDADPLVFLSYLTHGIQQLVPSFGKALFSYLHESAGELSQHPERGVDVLLNEVLERVEQQLIIVLDDYHHLGADTAVHAVLDRLLAYLPDVLHVIIISREMPPISLARLRAQSPLSIVDRADLLFTDEETQELFRKIFDLELTQQQLDEYRQRTHGWITALQLVRQVAQRTISNRDKGKPESNDLVEVLTRSERDIFDYFAEEVFSDESIDTQNLLLRLSLLDSIELDACAVLFEGLNCARVLPTLVRRNVFITAVSDGHGEEYRLHPLFHSFLRRRFRSEIGRTKFAAEHARLAAYFLKRRAWESAVRHLLAAEEFDQAASVIAERGSEWIASGAISSLASLAGVLPPAAAEAHPKALANQGEVARLRGEYDVAQTLFRRAVNLLRQQGDAEGEAEALHSLAALARREGEFEQAFSYLDRALQLAGANSAVLMKCGNTRGLCLVAMGNWTAAEREFRAALQSAEERNDEYYMRLIAHNLGTPAGIRGDFGEALRWLGRMLREDRPGAPMPQEAIAHLNMARCHLYRGNFDNCEKHLERALDRCQVFNLTRLRGEIFEAYGNLYRERRDGERATEFYERAARAYDDAGIPLGKVELLEERALLYLQAGDAATARKHIDRLLHSRPVEKGEISFYTASLTRGRVMLGQGQHAEAQEELQKALQYFHENGLYYYEAQACLASAGCESKLGHEPQTLLYLRRALELAARYDYEYWLQREVTNNPDLFSTDEALELLPAELRDELSSMKAHQTPAAANAVVEIPIATGSLTDLTINMLGPVEIVRDPARPLGADAWTTRRARDILCFIASRRHRRASKDAIIDAFWGETDLEVVEKNFHPTVSHIRKALNSNQALKQNFLLYRDGDYQFNAEFSYRIDIEEFDRLLAEGESARRAHQFDDCIKAYEAAIALYRGEFMQGSYDVWVEEQRSYYNKQHLRLLESLAAVAEKTKDWDRAMQLAQRIIQDDPFREDIHCLLMRAHAAQGNRGAVKEQYESLRRVLTKELGVEPGNEARRTYQELLK